LSKKPAAGALLSRETILAASDMTTDDVYVPEWRGTVRVRALTGRERDAFEMSCLVGKGRNKDVNVRNLRARLVAWTAVDEQGARVFADEDILALGAKSASALDRVFEVAQKLSRLSDNDVEELTEDFEPAPNGSSISA
jgi:hypothetical protein